VIALTERPPRKSVLATFNAAAETTTGARNSSAKGFSIPPVRNKRTASWVMS
jgi:hypothetical protein